MSSILFHGPTAKDLAVAYAEENGRLVAPPIGDSGLKIQEVRDLTELLRSTPVGMQTGMVVIGPMDQTASLKAADGLLKSIEDHSDMVIPLLWANDLGGVSPTIRSRCLPKWCPPSNDTEDSDLETDGRALFSAATEGRLWQVPTLVHKHRKDLHGLMGVLAEAISESPEHLPLWERLRPVSIYGNPSVVEVVAALLPEVAE